jgi:hypothetical protein
MKRSSLAEGVRLVRRLVERLIYVYVGASGNGRQAIRLVARQCCGRFLPLQLGLLLMPVHVATVNCCVSRVVLRLWKVRLHIALNMQQDSPGQSKRSGPPAWAEN